MFGSDRPESMQDYKELCVGTRRKNLLCLHFIYYLPAA